jgi:16S rRNA (guanine966-N2)-methyltransferase
MVNKQCPSDVRIIGGRWRGRKIPVLDQIGLRPTPARVRETVFNWLQADIVGAHCLDLFAGSGALGIEALSRGAAFVDFIDNSARVIQHLHTLFAQLHIDNVRARHGDALALLPSISHKIDIVFLDPPFKTQLLLACCSLLEQVALLNQDNRLYLETDHALSAGDLSEKWECLREKKAGNVYYYLFHCQIDH